VLYTIWIIFFSSFFLLCVWLIEYQLLHRYLVLVSVDLLIPDTSCLPEGDSDDLF